MTANELLLWLSARKQGSWPQFRGAVEALDLAQNDSETGDDSRMRLHQRVQQDLERLGHAEFDTKGCENGWRVVPPVLALTTDQHESIGILCGARTLQLLERLEQAAASVAFERTPHPGCPDVIRLRSPIAGALSRAAVQAGMLYQTDAPTALLSRLPPVNRLDGFLREPLPASGKDWETQHLVIEKKTMKWQPVTIREANADGTHGLFRFIRFQTPQYFLKKGLETIKLPGAVGKYYVLSKRQRRVLRYDRNNQALSVRALFRPPLLTERALILCSGFPPAATIVRGLPMLTYRSVPEDVAALAAQVLNQDLL